VGKDNLKKNDNKYTIELLQTPVVVGHGSQSMMGLSIDSSSVAMNLRTVRISKSKKKSTTRAGNNKGGSFSVSCDLIILCLHLNF